MAILAVIPAALANREAAAAMKSAALAFAIVFLPAASAPAQATMWVFGPGSVSCATWLAADQPGQRDVEYWIMGYWSGLNYDRSAGKTVGSSSDTAGILGEVRLRCSKLPSATLFRAVTDVYEQLETQHR